MKILLLGKGKSIFYIKKYLKSKNVDYIQAVYENELDKNCVLLDENLLNLCDIDYAIKAPGIYETDKMYLKLSNKFKFISELDLLYIFKEKVKCIVVTGSNGKSTLVSMINFIFKQCNVKSISCGNSFLPITYYYKKFNKLDYLIVEQSSFQLHNLRYYRPFISIICNLQPNHLDASYSLNSYYEIKKNIFRYQNKNEYFILDENNKLLQNIDCNASIVSLLNYPYLDKIDKNLLVYKNNINYIYTIFKILSLDINKIVLINQFKTLKYHLQEKVVKDVKFINDSKSTSVDATLFALSTIIDNKNTILIIGGKDKNLSLDRLNTIKVNQIICYGQLINKAKKVLKKVILADCLANAFTIAINIKCDNKIILFSPLCSSFDQFKNYKDRGKCFDKLVNLYEKNKL